jgi:hypothetical protein
MSFSFNEVESTCVKSKSCVQYDLEFDLYAKRSKKQEGEAAFRHLGAMKYVYTGKGDRDVTAHIGKTEGWCEQNCKKRMPADPSVIAAETASASSRPRNSGTPKGGLTSKKLAQLPK